MDGEGAGQEQEQEWSMWQILLHPIASYDDLVETLQSSSDSTFKEVGYTLAVALNVILFLTKFTLPHTWRLMFGVGLLLLSIAFTVRLCTRKRRYQIYQRADSLPFHSPNLHTIVMSPRKGDPGTSGVAGWNDITEVRELDMWDPPAISSIVFCAFSPMQVLVVLSAPDTDTTACFFALGNALVIAFATTYMFRMFTTWKDDHGIIHRQAYDEQNRFMISQTARPKADAAIQADAVDTRETSLLYPAYPPTVIVVPPTPTTHKVSPSSSIARAASYGTQTASPATQRGTPPSTTSTPKKRRKSTNPFQQGA